MDFRLPEDHVALGDLARTILAEHSQPERLANLEKDGGWFDRDLWTALASSGLVGICLPADAGGGGLDELAEHVLLQELGATAAHVPLFETTVLGARVVARLAPSDLRHQLVGGVVAGTTILTAALHDEGSDDPARPTALAERDGNGGLRVTGAKTMVPCAALADHLVVTATTPEGETAVVLVAADTPGLEVQPQRTPSDVPHARVALDGVVVDEHRVLAVGAEADAALGDLLDHARVGIASMQAGIVRAAVAMAASHTSTREQFGRPIATFQAVRQRVADARIASEMLSLTSLQAAWMLAEGMPATDEILIAKWWAGEAGHVALHAVHHVHGGIGVDREYPLHRLFGRAKAHEFALGNGASVARALGSRIAAAVPEEQSA